MVDINEIILQEVRETRAELKAHRLESNVRHDSLELRVRTNERWISDANGKITMFGLFCAAVGSAVAWVAGIIHKTGH